MAKITIPVMALKYTLVGDGADKAGSAVAGMAKGQTMASGWTDAEITRIFQEANAIWLRLAEISFAPVAISERTDTAPADETDLWRFFVRTLSPLPKRGVVVAFVSQLTGPDGGWSAPPFSVISGAKAKAGSPELGGRILAHELGHILLEDLDHKEGSKDKANLMFPDTGEKVQYKMGKKTTVVSPGIISEDQKATALKKAAELTRA